MKTELEKKLNKLPAYVTENSCPNSIVYQLKIQKTAENNHWFIEYTDKNYNSILIIEHKSLQAAVDNALREIKSL